MLDVEFNVRDLLEIINITSFTLEEYALSSFLAQRMRTLGIVDVRLDEQGNVVGVVRFKDAESRKLAFMANLDTGKPEGKMPESGVVDGEQFGGSGDYVTGLGAVAPKASVAAVMSALENTINQKNDLRGTLVIAFVVKDLIANHDGPEAIAEQLKDADFILSAEPTGNAIVSSTRGILQFEVTYEGIPVHRGNPDHMLNIFYAVANFISLLRSEPVICDPCLGNTGFNPFYISCQAEAPLTPKEITVKVDRRLLPNERAEDAESRINEMAAASVRDSKNVSVDVKILSKMYPFAGNKGTAEYDILESAVAYATGAVSKVIAPKFASNISYFSEKFNSKGLILGPGRLEDMHPIEHVSVEEVKEAIAIYSYFIKEYMRS